MRADGKNKHLEPISSNVNEGDKNNFAPISEKVLEQLLLSPEMFFGKNCKHPMRPLGRKKCFLIVSAA